MILGVNQPNFLPWFGYYDLIKNVDTFVFLSSIKSPKNPSSFIFRNKFYYKEKYRWITFPLEKSERLKYLYEISFSQKNLNDTLNLLTTYIDKDPYYNFVKENILNSFYEFEIFSFPELSKSIIINTLKQLKIETKILNCYDIVDINFVKKKI